ncbi:hypothetical protein L7H23_10055 [Sphingopyxis sp. BSN-002]|uniref:hypothetical protein n=1 Tax=Sphingopyxis sp. BSN-002 TaxID=2911495 RepID=UPI001EDB45D1|nr:hypothetical protein [Sphingopyxis sp. BSN-002]UKK82915.1 hypothetical protein L7H23_10055 [Sphingopyxis sp. BSN-002]
MKPIVAALVALFLALTASPASAADWLAPLPEGTAGSKQAPIRGLYAEFRFSRADVNERLETLEATCRERGIEPRIAGRDLLSEGVRRIYRGSAGLAIFEDAPSIATDSDACTASISLRRSVEIKPGPRGRFLTDDWIKEQPKCSWFSRCRSGEVAGVQARCFDLGDGLVGTIVCYSTQDDFSRDLIVSRWNYSDDGSVPDSGWMMDRVVADALIDPVVFRAAPGQR